MESSADEPEIVKSKETGKKKISEEKPSSSVRRELLIPKSEIVPIKLKNSYK